MISSTGKKGLQFLLIKTNSTLCKLKLRTGLKTKKIQRHYLKHLSNLWLILTMVPPCQMTYLSLKQWLIISGVRITPQTQMNSQLSITMIMNNLTGQSIFSLTDTFRLLMSLAKTSMCSLIKQFQILTIQGIKYQSLL